MYKTKPCSECEMPAPGLPLRALVLNASLKHQPEGSNTQEVADLVLAAMKERHSNLVAESIRVSDLNLPVGLSETPSAIRATAPEFGQHTESVLLDELGFSWDEIAVLREKAVI